MKTLKILFLILFLDLIISKILKNPKILYVDFLPKNYNGITIPPLFILINKNQYGNYELIQHELQHWKQSKPSFLFFYFAYFLESFNMGYDKNKFEISARQNETDFCKNNYTLCVQNGQSKTVNNPNFRK